MNVLESIVAGFKQINHEMKRQNEIYSGRYDSGISEANSASLLIVFDKMHNIVFLSDEWIEYSPIKLDSFIFQNESNKQCISEIVDEIGKYLDEVIINKTKINFLANPVDTRNGVRYLEFRLLPIYEEEDNVIGIIALAHDVSEHIMIKKELEVTQLIQMKKEAFYKKLFNHTQIAFALHKLVFDDKGTVTDFEYVDLNPAYEKETGYSLKDLIGKTLFTVFPDYELHSADWIKLFTEAEKNSSKVTIEHGYYRSDNCYRTSIYSPEKGYVATFSNNITNYKKAEKKLIENEDRWKTALMSAEQGVWQWRFKKGAGLDLEKGQFPNSEGYCSPWYKDFFGIEVANGTAWLSSWNRIVHPDDRKHMKEHICSTLINEPEVFVNEHRIIDGDGVVCWLMVKGKKVDSKKSDIIEYIGVHTDISDFKKMQQIVNETQMHYRILYENLTDVIVILQVKADDNVQLIETNAAFHEKLKYTKHEVQHLSIFTMCTKNMVQQFREFLFGLKEELNGVIGIEFKTKDGENIWLEVRARKFKENNEVYILLIGRELSEWKEIERHIHIVKAREIRNTVLNELVNGNRAMVEQGNLVLAEYRLDRSEQKELSCFVVEFNVRDDISNNSNVSYKIQNLILDNFEKNSEWLCWIQSDKIAMICCINEAHRNYHTLQKEIAAEIVDRVKDINPHLDISVAISPPFKDIGNLQVAFSNCLVAKKFGAKLWPAHKIYHYNDLGLYKLFTNIDDKQILQEYIRHMLGSLLNYDSNKRDEYLSTLELILESDNLSEVANKGYIHHKTVQLRKKKIEKIMGVSLDNIEVRMRVMMAIKLMKIYELDGLS